MLPLFNGRRLHNSAALLSSHAQCPITYDDPLCYACVSQTTETRGRQSRLDVAKVKQIGRKRNINSSAQCCCWLNRPHLGCGNQAHLAQEQLKLPKEREGKAEYNCWLSMASQKYCLGVTDPSFGSNQAWDWISSMTPIHTYNIKLRKFDNCRNLYISTSNALFVDTDDKTSCSL